MKQGILFAAIMICSTRMGFTQKMELGVSLNSGLFSFSGKGAQNNTTMIWSDNSVETYSQNPYGKIPVMGLGVSGKVALVTRERIVWALDLGYEAFRSKTKVRAMTVYNFLVSGPSYYSEEPASGSIFIHNNFINLFPSAGYRFKGKKINIEVSGGLDVALCLQSKEEGQAMMTLASGRFTTRGDRRNINADLRPRMQVAASYKNISLYTGYSLGLTDYRKGIDLENKAARSRLLRMGISYRLQ